jgi:UDP-N-acetyl-D-glucosamine dehydrogenase
MQSQDLAEAAARADCCVIITNHSNVDYAALLDAAAIVVDTRNALKAFRSGKIFRL